MMQNHPSQAHVSKPQPVHHAGASERQAAVAAWKRLVKAGKLCCQVNCPLGAIGECSYCGR